MASNTVKWNEVKEKLAKVVLMTIFAGFFHFRHRLTNGKSMTFTQNIRSGNISIEVDGDERTYYRFTEYSYLPADGSDSLLRPVYGQVGGDASV